MYAELLPRNWKVWNVCRTFGKKYFLTYCFFFSILELMNGMVARKLRVMDFVFVAAVAGVIVFLFLRLGRNSDDSKKNLVVQSSAGGEFVFPLDRDGLYEVPGSLGKSVIEVKDGKARFVDSPCPNRTCVQQGFISVAGQWAACLPNNVLLMIQGSAKKGSVDAVAN